MGKVKLRRIILEAIQVRDLVKLPPYAEYDGDGLEAVDAKGLFDQKQTVQMLKRSSGNLTLRASAELYKALLQGNKALLQVADLQNLDDYKQSPETFIEKVSNAIRNIEQLRSKAKTVQQQMKTDVVVQGKNTKIKQLKRAIYAAKEKGEDVSELEAQLQQLLGSEVINPDFERFSKKMHNAIDNSDGATVLYENKKNGIFIVGVVNPDMSKTACHLDGASASWCVATDGAQHFWRNYSARVLICVYDRRGDGNSWVHITDDTLINMIIDNVPIGGRTFREFEGRDNSSNDSNSLMQYGLMKQKIGLSDKNIIQLVKKCIDKYKLDKTKNIGIKEYKLYASKQQSDEICDYILDQPDDDKKGYLFDSEIALLKTIRKLQNVGDESSLRIITNKFIDSAIKSYSNHKYEHNDEKMTFELKPFVIKTLMRHEVSEDLLYERIFDNEEIMRQIPFQSVQATGDDELINYFLKRRSDYQSDMFIEYVVQKDYDSIYDMIDNGFDPNTKSSIGDYPIIRACITGDIDMVETLLDEGCLVNVTADNKFTPLSVVSTSNNEKLFDIILNEVLDLNDRHEKFVDDFDNIVKILIKANFIYGFEKLIKHVKFDQYDLMQSIEKYAENVDQFVIVLMKCKGIKFNSFSRQFDIEKLSLQTIKKHKDKIIVKGSPIFNGSNYFNKQKYYIDINTDNDKDYYKKVGSILRYLNSEVDDFTNLLNKEGIDRFVMCCVLTQNTQILDKIDFKKFSNTSFTSSYLVAMRLHDDETFNKLINAQVSFGLSEKDGHSWRLRWEDEQCLKIVCDKQYYQYVKAILNLEATKGAFEGIKTMVLNDDSFIKTCTTDEYVSRCTNLLYNYFNPLAVILSLIDKGDNYQKKLHDYILKSMGTEEFKNLKKKRDKESK